jgi:hypothetical protein
MGQAVRLLGNVELEVECQIERAEDKAHDARGLCDLVDRRHTVRAFDEREDLGVGQRRPYRSHLHRRLGLCSITSGKAAGTQRPQVFRELAEPASLMRTTTRARSAAEALAAQSAMASRALAFASGATASSRSSTTLSAPLASAFAKRSGRLPGTNR